jgi:hypothetical protein
VTTFHPTARGEIMKLKPKFAQRRVRRTRFDSSVLNDSAARRRTQPAIATWIAMLLACVTSAEAQTSVSRLTAPPAVRIETLTETEISTSVPPLAVTRRVDRIPMDPLLAQAIAAQSVTAFVPTLTLGGTLTIQGRDWQRHRSRHIRCGRHDQSDL